jgi:hypothetical protein
MKERETEQWIKREREREREREYWVEMVLAWVRNDR